MTRGHIESREDVMDVACTLSNWDASLAISISLGSWLICTPSPQQLNGDIPKNVTLLRISVVRIRHMWEFSVFSTCLYIQKLN